MKYFWGVNAVQSYATRRAVMSIGAAPKLFSLRIQQGAQRWRITSSAVLAMIGMLIWVSPVVAQTGSAPTVDVHVPVASDPSGAGLAASASSDSDSDLAKKLQNPIGDLISVPF